MTSILVFVLGVRGAGKSTLLARLQNQPGIAVLQPSTNRPQRSAADLEYDFVQIWDSSSYAWEINVGGYTYGMRKSELERIQSDVGITVFEPSSIDALVRFREASQLRIYTVGLDTVSSWSELDERIGSDDKKNVFDGIQERSTNCN